MSRSSLSWFKDRIEVPFPTAEKFQEILGLEMKWVTCANQTHRAPAHNLTFLQSDRGCGNLGMSSLEGLESSNFSAKNFDDHHTFRGDRKAANRGVFKLLRLRGSRILRKYPQKQVRTKKCSICKEAGHNKLSKECRGFAIEVNDREDGLFEVTTSLGWGVLPTAEINVDDANNN